MFSENNKLSPAGTFKLLITSFLAPVMLFSMYLADAVSLVEGVIILFLIYLLSWGYLRLILYTDFVKSSVLMALFVLLKSLCLCTLSVLALTKSIYEMLLPGTSVWFIALFSLAAGIFLSRKNSEVRGRLCEFLYLFVLIPILICLVFGFIHIDYLHLLSQFSSISNLHLTRMLLLSAAGFLSLCPGEFLLVGTPFYYKESASKHIFIKSALLLFLLGILQFVISSLTYTLDSTLFIIISLLLYLSGCLHYGDLAVLDIIHSKKNYVVYLYALISFCFVLLFLFSSFGLDYKNNGKLVDARELEDRTFVTSMIIQYDDALSIICETSDYTEDTAIPKYIYFTASKDCLSTENPFLSLLKSYPLEGGKRFDFSHIEAVVLNISGENPSATDNFIQVTKEYRIPMDTLIFQKKDFPNTYDNLTSRLDSISFGKVLKNLAKNQDITKQKTLRSFCLSYS